MVFDQNLEQISNMAHLVTCLTEILIFHPGDQAFMLCGATGLLYSSHIVVWLDIACGYAQLHKQHRDPTQRKSVACKDLTGTLDSPGYMK